MLGYSSLFLITFKTFSWVISCSAFLYLVVGAVFVYGISVFAGFFCLAIVAFLLRAGVSCFDFSSLLISWSSHDSDLSGSFEYLFETFNGTEELTLTFETPYYDNIITFLQYFYKDYK